MTFDPPLEVVITSKVVGGKFYNLDETKEVGSPRYAKFIRSMMDLTPIEMDFILLRYSALTKDLGKISTFIAKITN